MTKLYLLLPPIIAAAASWLLTPLARRVAMRLGAVDAPGPRKVHQAPVPRLGGLAVIIAILGSWAVMYRLIPGEGAVFSPAQVTAAALGLLPVICVSLLDDMRQLSPTVRFVVQLVGASIAVVLGVQLGPSVHLFATTIPLGVLAAPISVLWIVFITNAFNLADGLDGLSTGLGLISALSLAAIGALSGGLQAAVPAAVLVGALVGFLPYNLYPARVFLGDVGSTGIGFILACLALSGGGTRLSAGLAVLVPVLAMGVPIAETLVSIFRRLLRAPGGVNGGGVFQADGDHFHHRLLAMGFTQRRATMILWLVGLGMAAIGLVSIFVTARQSALLLVTMLAAAFLGVQRLGYEEFAVVRRGILLRFYDMPVLRINFFRVFVDVAAVAVSLYLALALKQDRWSLRGSELLIAELLPILALSTMTVFAVFKLYRRSWRAASVEDLVRAAIAVVAASAVGFLLAALARVPGVSVGLFGIYTLAFLAAITGMRSSFRILQNWRARDTLRGDAVLIYGAGSAGQMAASEMIANHDLHLHPVGFIDDDPQKHGRYVLGFPVLGSVEHLEGLIRSKGARVVVVASQFIQSQALDSATQTCDRLGVTLVRFGVSFTGLDAGGAARARRIRRVR